jgi:hypothetical protein
MEDTDLERQATIFRQHEAPWPALGQQCNDLVVFVLSPRLVHR